MVSQIMEKPKTTPEWTLRPKSLISLWDMKDYFAIQLVSISDGITNIRLAALKYEDGAKPLGKDAIDDIKQDLDLIISEAGVMRIGIDVATLSLKRLVDRTMFYFLEMQT